MFNHLKRSERSEGVWLTQPFKEIKEIGRGLVVQPFKGKNNNFVLNAGFHRKPV